MVPSSSAEGLRVAKIREASVGLEGRSVIGDYDTCYRKPKQGDSRLAIVIPGRRFGKDLQGGLLTSSPELDSPSWKRWLFFDNRRMASKR